MLLRFLQAICAPVLLVLFISYWIVGVLLSGFIALIEWIIVGNINFTITKVTLFETFGDKILDLAIHPWK